MHYVAEHHENLNHVLVFLTVLNVVPGADIKAEVLPSSPNSAEGGHLVISCGLDTSPTLHLPVPTVPGIKDVKVHSGYFELKLATSSVEAQAFEPIPLLDASQLSTLNPTSFTCASCSLPLVQSSKIDMYRDLPSEHWEELVDAWMCHADQTLHEQVTKHGRGFWPQAGQALIGGSYILFEESSVVKTNLYLAEQPKVNTFLLFPPLLWLYGRSRRPTLAIHRRSLFRGVNWLSVEDVKPLAGFMSYKMAVC